jgi:hypothetical protein
MSVTVYWSPWGEQEQYASRFLSYQTPDRLVDGLKQFRNEENRMDNFLMCPAFNNSIKNTFVFRAPTDVNIRFTAREMFNHLDPNRPFDPETIKPKAPSLINSTTVQYKPSWVFFCEETMLMQTSPPYMHQHTVAKHGYIVPGSFDISNWFRPVESAIQLWPNQNEVQINQDDPLLYVNFINSQPVKLQKFYLTNELYDIGMSCVNLKGYRFERSLSKLYNIFQSSRLKNKLLDGIKNNLLD